MGRAFHIAIEQNVIVGIHLLQGSVVALGKSVVLVQKDQLQGGILLPEKCHRIVGGSVVGHNHPSSFAVGDYGREETLQHRAAVPVEYDDSYAFHLLGIKIGISAGRVRFHRR